MAATNTDLTEEDATDLQFPKAETTDETCTNCSNLLLSPYILCAQCEANICTQCFANGSEFQNHKNDHDYRIIRDDFPLYSNTDWTANEELTLLDAIEKFVSWELVSKQLTNRSVSDVRAHYDRFYLQANEMPEMPESAAPAYIEPVVPYRAKIDFSEEPPRYTPNTVGYVALAGYNPARSDFESEFDANAEDLLTGLKPVDADDPYYDLMTKLQCGIVDGYNRRLIERERWKKIVRDHGLILLRKTNAWLHRFDLTITKTVYEKLVNFMQFCTPTQFEMLMEGLHHSGELKIKVLRLCELRQKGVRSMSDARLYMRLKALHEKYEFELKKFHSSMQFNWKATNKSLLVDMPCASKKPRFRPIEVIGMPGFEKLSANERELCKTARLVPIAYLELKELLINENKKVGTLKLKTARKMLKIDVNKTRKLYDFLAQEGFINKPD